MRSNSDCRATLRSFGYVDMPWDGGDRAVRFFQINNGLEGDNIIGPQTEAKLFSNEEMVVRIKEPFKPREPCTFLPISVPLHVAFGMIVSGAPKRVDVAAMPGFKPIAFLSGDGCAIHGWVYRKPGSDHRGTCIMCHGFCDNSSSFIENAKELGEEHGLTVIAFDSRYHGWTEKRFPTFGCYEGFDMQAAMDFADLNRFPKPYTLYGISLGGMAAQRAAIEDERVAGVFLVSTPGWPWDAIGRCAQIGCPAANLISAAYGWDVLTDGDIRTHRQPPGHRPLICHIMGELDRYGADCSKQVFNHWHDGEAGIVDRLPEKGEKTSKIFFTTPGIEHPDTQGKKIWDCIEFNNLQKFFFQTVL